MLLFFEQPPLPEYLVRSYMQTRLRGFVAGLQRNLRMARMSGRFSDKDQDRIVDYDIPVGQDRDQDGN